MSKNQGKKIKCNDPRTCGYKKVTTQRSGIKSSPTKAKKSQTGTSLTGFSQGLKERNEFTKVLNFAFMIMIYCAIVMGIEYLAHINDADAFSRQFAQFSGIYFLFVVLGFGVYALLSLKLVPRIKIVTADEFEGGWLRISIQLVACTMIIALSQIFIGVIAKFVKFAISDIELYMYYINAGIAEEVAFRFGIQGSLESFFTLKYKAPNVIFGRIAAITATAVIFMIFHWDVYKDDPFSFISTFFSGIVFGLFYSFTGNIFISIVSHMVNNLVAVIFHPPVNPSTIYQISAAPSYTISTTIVYSICLVLFLVSTTIQNNKEKIKKRIIDFYMINKPKVILLILIIVMVVILIIAYAVGAYDSYKILFDFR